MLEMVKDKLWELGIDKRAVIAFLLETVAGAAFGIAWAALIIYMITH